MTSRNLYREIGKIDDELVEEAAQFQSRKQPYNALKYGCLVACLVLVVVGFGTLQSRLFEGTPSPSRPPSSHIGESIPEDSPAGGGAPADGGGANPSATDPSFSYGEETIAGEGVPIDESAKLSHDSLSLNSVTYLLSSDMHIEGHFWVPLADREQEPIFHGLANDYPITAIANYSEVDETISLFDISSSIQLTEDITARVQISPTEVDQCYLIEGDPILSDIEGIPIIAGAYIRAGKGRYYADFEIGNTAYYVEFEGIKKDEYLLTELVSAMISYGEADFSRLDPVASDLRNYD